MPSRPKTPRFGRGGRPRRALRWPRMKVAAAALTALALCSFAAGAATRPHALAGCAVFPADNPWNQRVDSLPVASNSGGDHLDDRRRAPASTPTSAPGKWDGGPIGIPYNVVRRDAEEGPRRVLLRRRERPRPVPDPGEAGDRVRQRPPHPHRRPRHCRLYELYDAQALGREVDGGLGRDLEPRARTRCGRPAGRRRTPPACRSFPGSRATTRSPPGTIDHALRFTVQRTRRAYVYPARHDASDADRPEPAADGPPRCGCARASTRAASRGRRAIVLEALKRYGMMVADNGSNWYISGAPDAALVERRPAHARPRQGIGLRGRSTPPRSIPESQD